MTLEEFVASLDDRQIEFLLKESQKNYDFQIYFVNELFECAEIIRDKRRWDRGES